MQMYGSRVICNPPPKNTDEDWIIYTEDLNILNEELRSDDWILESGMYEGNDFFSYRRGFINFVVTTNLKFYDATVKATQIAKDLNLLNKTDRKALFLVVYHACGLKYDTYEIYGKQG